MTKQLPKAYTQFRDAYPEVAQAYDALGDAARRAGPLDEQTAELIKLALSIGAGLEGAAHSHARKALEHGVEPEALKQVALMAMTTLGFPSTVRAYTWIQDVLEE